MDRADCVIRDARKTDIDSIFELWVESMKFHEELDPLIFGFISEKSNVAKRFIGEQFNKKSSVILVAEKEDRVIGYLLGEIRERLPFQRLQVTGYIWDIVITSGERNKGIGSLLLEKAFDFFKDRNLDTVMLNVSEKNRNAQRFYERHGFEPYLRYMVKRRL